LKKEADKGLEVHSSPINQFLSIRQMFSFLETPSRRPRFISNWPDYPRAMLKPLEIEEFFFY
jgi:hypothetical protein